MMSLEMRGKKGVKTEKKETWKSGCYTRSWHGSSLARDVSRTLIDETLEQPLPGLFYSPWKSWAVMLVN